MTRDELERQLATNGYRLTVYDSTDRLRSKGQMPWHMYTARRFIAVQAEKGRGAVSGHSPQALLANVDAAIKRHARQRELEARRELVQSLTRQGVASQARSPVRRLAPASMHA